MQMSPVHVIKSETGWLAYFIRTGDLLRVSERAAETLQQVESGASYKEALRRLGYESDSELSHDMGLMERAGLFGAEEQSTDSDRLADYKRLFRHKPRNIMLFVTEACNLACTYCYERTQGVHENPRNLRLEDAKVIVDSYLVETGNRTGITITFFGGEPLVNSHVIREVVDYSKQRAAMLGKTVGFTMTTNLTLLTEDMADFLAAERFHVMVSIDGRKEDHDRHRVTRDGRGTHDLVIYNFKMLCRKMRAAGTRLPKIRATLNADNSDPVAVEAYLRTLGTPLVVVGESNGTSFNKRRVDVGVTLEQKKAIADRVAKSAQDVLSQLESGAGLHGVSGNARQVIRKIHCELSRPRPHDKLRPALCGTCRNMKAATPDGSLYPCHRYVGMQSYKIGNVYTGGVEQDLVSKYYQKIYSVFMSKCRYCWLRHLCGGQCPWYLSEQSGTMDVPDESSCEQIKAGYESYLGLYAALATHYPHDLAQLVDTSSSDSS